MASEQRIEQLFYLHVHLMSVKVFFSISVFFCQYMYFNGEGVASFVLCFFSAIISKGACLLPWTTSRLKFGLLLKQRICS